MPNSRPKPDLTIKQNLVQKSVAPQSGEVEKWRSGEVEKWRSGEVEKWRSGEVEKWRSGEVEKSGSREVWGRTFTKRNRRTAKGPSGGLGSAGTDPG
jgi:hypothetical protein